MIWFWLLKRLFLFFVFKSIALVSVLFFSFIYFYLLALFVLGFRSLVQFRIIVLARATRVNVVQIWASLLLLAFSIAGGSHTEWIILMIDHFYLLIGYCPIFFFLGGVLFPGIAYSLFSVFQEIIQS